MFLAFWISCAVACIGLMSWRLRAATATLHAILDEPSADEAAADPLPAAEPAGMSWPHPPRLWVDR